MRYALKFFFFSKYFPFVGSGDCVENFRKRFNNLDPNRTIKSTNLTIME